MKSSSKVSGTQMVHFSPLRYPGGKGKLAAFVKAIILENGLSDGDYVEPYAGGAAVAMELLLQEYVSRVRINDISRPVHSFWKCVLSNTEELCRRVRDTPLTVSAWDKNKTILMNQVEYDDMDLGFATFYLNRTNRSGILNGGIIGGRDQLGGWKMDARYNGVELVNRITSIAKLKSRIFLTKQDAVKFLKSGADKWPAKTLVYLDPPYYQKGRDLYYDFYDHADHVEVADVVQKAVKSQKWLVSYDNAAPIRQIYRGCKSVTYRVGYSARRATEGAEVMFFCKDLLIPALAGPISAIEAA